MKLVKLNTLFKVEYGNKFDLMKMTVTSSSKDGAVAFISRMSSNNGVVAFVEKHQGVEPYKENLVTVTLGGSMLLSAFIQQKPFYTAQNVAVLTPLKSMSTKVLLYYCFCIGANRHKYSAFGREANRTLKSLEVPKLSEVPKWVGRTKIKDISKLLRPEKSRKKTLSLEPKKWKEFSLVKLFDIKKGKRLTKGQMQPGDVPFIGATDSDNGVTAFIKQDPIHDANTITVSYNGSVGEAFYQTSPFWASDDVNVLYPKFELNPYRAMFLISIIRMQRHKFSFGRKWNLERMKVSSIRLPVKATGEPNWNYIEEYIKCLPFSSRLSVK